MPELPDVEVYRRYLRRTSFGKRVRSARLAAPEMLEDTRPRALTSRMKGSRFKATRRRGKYLFTELDRGGWLLLHFGMTGELEHSRSGVAGDHVRLDVEFEDGSQLVFRDVRKLGRIGLVDDVDEYIEAHHLGPDALDARFDLDAFKRALAGRKTAIKATLMNQDVLAGVGNVYGDEILFQAGVHPAARTDRLGDETLRSLHRALVRVLKTAIDARADPERFPKSFIIPQRRPGGACPRCGRELKRITVSGRTTWYCPTDQKRRR
jgi:formamidopyrimidine-DNA glycosylase